MATINTNEAFDQRAIAVAGDVPLDKRTKEPIMSEEAWCNKWIEDTLSSAICRAEKNKHIRGYVATPVAEDDITIT